MKKIIILAGDHRQYSDWLYDNVLPDVEELKKYIYASEPQKIMGVQAEKVLCIGTWNDKKDAEEMLKLANSRIF